MQSTPKWELPVVDDITPVGMDVRASTDPAYFFDMQPDTESQALWPSLTWISEDGYTDGLWPYDDELSGIRATRDLEEVYPPDMEEPESWR